MADYLWIVNWDRFQHYKDTQPRKLAWIKFYVDTLDNLDLRAMTIPTRLLWDQLLLLAARYGNPIEADAKTLAGLTGIPVRNILESIPKLVSEGMVKQTRTRRKPAPQNGSRARESLELRARGGGEVERDKETPPAPPQSGGVNGSHPLTKRQLAKYTGCRYTRGTHGATYVHDPLGQAKPPPDWPHPRPEPSEIASALAILATVAENT